MMERLPLAALGLLLGWCLGGLSARLTMLLEGADARPLAPGPYGLVAPDRLVQGCCALTVGLAMTMFGEPWWRGAAAGLLSVPLVQVAITDLRTRYVYTIYAAIGVLLGLGLGWLVHGAPWWTSVAGAIGGAVAFGVLYGLGFLIFKVEAMARGDITIAAMVGAGAAACTPQALLYGVLFGGLFGALTLVLRRTLGTYMPYGPGLCLGGLVTLFVC